MQERAQTGSAREAPERRSVPSSPVDDHTYDVLQALASTLESIEAYEVYAGDDPGSLFDDLLSLQREQAQRLMDELRGCLAS